MDESRGTPGESGPRSPEPSFPPADGYPAPGYPTARQAAAPREGAPAPVPGAPTAASAVPWHGPRPSIEEIDRLLGGWVREGLITQETADSVLDAERGRDRGTTQEHTEQTPSRSRVPVVTEILAYLGGTLVLAAVFTYVGMSWRDLGSLARVALLAVAAVVSGGAGVAVLRGGRGDQDPVRRRLVSFLWTLAALAVGGICGVLVEGPIDGDAETVFTALGIGTAVVALLAWWRLPTPLLEAAVFVPALVAAVAALAHSESVEEEGFGLLLYALSAVWFALAWFGAVTPRRTGLALGAVGAGVGAQLFAAMGADSGSGAALLGVVTALGLLWLGVARREPVLTGLGVLGTLVFLPQLIFSVFGEALGAPLAFFVAGLVILVVSLVLYRARSGEEETPGT